MKKKEKTVEVERFETIYSQDDVDVLVDRKTGVNYMVANCNNKLDTPW